MLELLLMNIDIGLVLANFCSQYKILGYKKGDIVIRGDDEPTGVYFIREGVVKMGHVDLEGGELIVNLFKPGSFFPMTWAIGNVDNNYYYQALTSIKVAKVPKEDFLKFLKSNPEVLYDLTRRLLIGLDGVIFNMRYLISGSSSSKVAAILSMLVKRFGTKQSEGILIDLPLSHQEIAHFTGLARETVTLAINKFILDGVLVQRKRKIFVTDMSAINEKI